LSPAIAGAKIIYGAGMVELGMTFSLEQFLIDHDIINMIKSYTNGVPVNEETLSVKAIQEVGAGKSFLGHKTTLKNIDLPSNPEFFDRMMYGDWAKNGSRNIVDVTHEGVNKLKKNYKPTPIEKDLLKEMGAVVKRADKERKG